VAEAMPRPVVVDRTDPEDDRRQVGGPEDVHRAARGPRRHPGVEVGRADALDARRQRLRGRARGRVLESGRGDDRHVARASPLMQVVGSRPERDGL
jgi:hypothetical protein